MYLTFSNLRSVSIFIYMVPYLTCNWITLKGFGSTTIKITKHITIFRQENTNILSKHSFQINTPSMYTNMKNKGSLYFTKICLFEITIDQTNRRRSSDDSSGDHSYTEYCYYYHSSATISNAISTSKQAASREREEVSHNMRTHTPLS